MSLISSYGLFWNVEDVDWTKAKPRIFGIPKTGDKESSKVNFFDQRGVYVLYAGYDIVYVGQNSKQGLGKRLKDHFDDDLAERWDRFSWFGVRGVTLQHELTHYTQAANAKMPIVLDHIEAILISAAEPRLNRQGGSWGSKVKRYFQMRDDVLGPNHQEMIRQIHEKTTGDTE